MAVTTTQAPTVVLSASGDTDIKALYDDIRTRNRIPQPADVFAQGQTVIQRMVVSLPALLAELAQKTVGDPAQPLRSKRLAILCDVLQIANADGNRPNVLQTHLVVIARRVEVAAGARVVVEADSSSFTVYA